MSFNYDVIVIGTGPGGEGAAMRCAKEGKRVAVVDDFYEVGGSCTHKGTIPSKALRQASEMLITNGRIGNMNYQALLKQSESVINQQVKLRNGFYDRNLVDVHDGRAEFVDQNTVKVKLKSGLEEEFTAEKIVIATGSRPFHPMSIDFNHSRAVDSDKVLELEDNPRSIIIFGAGVIGCEYASIFRGLRIKVNLINSHETLLPFLDTEISEALSYHLRENGIMIRHNEEFESVDLNDDGVVVHLKSQKSIRADYLLWSAGRQPNTDNMGLEEIGVKLDKRGTVHINDSYQTSVDNIYAVGDVVGYPSLASAAYDQGRFAAAHICFGKCDSKLIQLIPTGIYTIPEISSIGATEKELTASQVPYEVGHSFFRHLARAQITGNTTGMLKILFHRETLEILGIHCFGAQASEIIHIGQAVMSQPGPANTLNYFINTTFNYPTMAEAYRVAALNGINRL